MLTMMMSVTCLVTCVKVSDVQASSNNLDDQAHYYEEGVTYRKILMHVVNQSPKFDQDMLDWINRNAAIGSGDSQEVSTKTTAVRDHNKYKDHLSNLINIDLEIKKGNRNVSSFTLNSEGDQLKSPFAFTYGYAVSIIVANSYKAKQREYASH